MESDVRRPAGFYFLTAVWGQSYVQLYLDTVIPAQLAAGNLPAFADDPATRYIIFTTTADAETIRAAPIFRKLSETVTTVVELIDENLDVPHDAMSNCYRRGIASADLVDAAIVFLTPDIVFADHSFATLKRLSQQGYDVVFIPAIRALKSSVAPALREKYQSDTAIQVEPADLMRLAFDHPHPIALASYWEEGDGDLVAPILYWRVGNDGVVARCFHLHPLLVNPQRKNASFLGTIDDDFVSSACPDDSRDYVVVDSDELGAIELSSLERVLRTGIPKRSVSGVSKWAELSANLRHRKLFQRSIRLHARITHPAAWVEAEARAAQAAAAIEQRLALPWWKLLLGCDGAFAFRCMRYAADHKFADANRSGAPPKTAAAARGNATSADVRAGWPPPSSGRPRKLRALVEIGLRGLSRAITYWYRRLWPRTRLGYRQAMAVICGSVHHPRIWSLQWNYLRRLGRLVSDILPPGRETVVLCADPTRSPPVHILRETSRPCATAELIDDGASVRLVGMATREPVAADSQDVVVLDRIIHDKSGLSRALPEIARILRPGGRLLILANNALGQGPIAAGLALTVESVVALLEPAFVVKDQRRLGGLGSAACQRFIPRARSLLAGEGIPFIVRVLVILLAVPLRLLLAVPLQICIFMLDRLDTNSRNTVLIAALAVKLPLDSREEATASEPENGLATTSITSNARLTACNAKDRVTH